MNNLDIQIDYNFQNLKELFCNSVRRGEIWEKEKLLKKAKENHPNFSSKDEADLIDWYTNLCELKFIWEYLDIETNREIIIHDSHCVQIQGIHGLQTITCNLPTIEELQISFEIMALKNHGEWNYSNPFYSFFSQINNIDVRISLVHFSVSPTICSSNTLSKIFIRKIQQETLELKNFDLKPHHEKLIFEMLEKKSNVLIAGSTGSGKTTLLSTMLNHIGTNEHVIILEDTHEIIIPRPSFSYLVSDSKDSDKRGIKDFCSYALRMRPDRIILGEMRSEEVIPFLLSMNTGHKGLISTVHANNARDALGRVAFLFTLFSGVKNMDYELALKLVCQNLDYVIYLKNRKVTEISKVLGQEKGIAYTEDMLSV